MSATAALLPGGLPGPDGALRREIAFRALDGRVEAAMRVAQEAGSRPAAISALLGAALQTPSGGAEAARALSVGDRQWLLAQLAVHLGQAHVWITGTCAACEAAFDAPLDLAALPVKPAGEGYPERTVEAPENLIRVRAPTGADQEAIAGLPEAEAVAVLLARCVDGANTRTLSPDTLERIDAALAEISPEAAAEVETTCPSCGAACRAGFDLADVVFAHLGDPFEDVHVIASAYHWSEGDILALPAARRRRYLHLIDQARGVTD